MAFLNYYLEVYFGENSNIKKMQQCITNLRKDVFKYGFTSKFNSHPEVKKFNRLAEDEFGFKTFQLYIDYDNEVDASCVPIYLELMQTGKKFQNNLIITKNGYKYKKEAGYVVLCVITTGALLSKDVTDREVMAFILHEIGHNFQMAISDYQCMILAPKKILTYIQDLDFISSKEENIEFIQNLIVEGLVITKIGRVLWRFLDDIMMQYPNLYHLSEMVSSLMSILQYPIDKFKMFINLMKMVPKMPMWLKKKLSPENLIILFLKGAYREEKIADNFATIYGYGPDLASLMSKYTSGDSVLNKLKIPIISPLLGLFQCTMITLLTLPDEHPHTITRVKDQSDYLKEELKKEDLDPKFRKEILEQIEEIDAIVDNVISLSYEGALTDYQYTNHLYQLLLYKIFGGDPLDIFYKLTTDGVHADLERVKQRKLEESSKLTKKLNKVKLI